MVNSETIEAYLARMGLPYRALESAHEQGAAWLVDDEGDEVPPIAIALQDPLIVFSCRVMPLSAQPATQLFRLLLELNASDMAAGAYGVIDDWVVVSDTLQSEHLDYNEFQGALDGIVMALSSHYPRLRQLQG